MRWIGTPFICRRSPKVLATKSTAAYYQELEKLCVRLGDGHMTNVYDPVALNASAKPPLRTGLIEGHVMILEVRSPSLEADGIVAGLEIVNVDGEPAIEYARRDVELYQSAATPQDRENRTFWVWIPARACRKDGAADPA